VDVELLADSWQQSSVQLAWCAHVQGRFRHALMHGMFGLVTFFISVISVSCRAAGYRPTATLSKRPHVSVYIMACGAFSGAYLVGCMQHILGSCRESSVRQVQGVVAHMQCLQALRDACAPLSCIADACGRRLLSPLGVLHVVLKGAQAVGATRPPDPIWGLDQC
jgi:hypothetical protein